MKKTPGKHRIFKYSNQWYFGCGNCTKFVFSSPSWLRCLTYGQLHVQQHHLSIWKVWIRMSEKRNPPKMATKGPVGGTKSPPPSKTETSLGHRIGDRKPGARDGSRPGFKGER